MKIRKLKTFLRLLAGGEFRWILKRLSEALPPGVFYYNRVAILTLAEHKTFRRAGGVTLRAAGPEDLSALADVVGKPAAEFRRRFEEGDLCFIAEAGGAVVSVEWVRLRKYRLEEVDYAFDPGPRGLFLYDAFTAPEWRLRGLHVNVLQHVVEWAPARGVEDVFCHITHGNDLSLRTHLRFGFRVAQYITQVRLLGVGGHRIKVVYGGKSLWSWNRGADSCSEKHA